MAQKTDGKQSIYSFFDNLQHISVRGHRQPCRSVAWSSNGANLASASADHTIRIWNTERILKNGDSFELRGHTAEVEQVVWHPSHPDQLASVSSDKTLKLWDIRAARSIISETQTNGENLYVDWSPDGSTVSAGSRDNQITFLDFKERKVWKQLKNRIEVNESRWSRDNKLWLLTTGTGTIRVYSWPDLEVLHTLEAHNSNCFSIDTDPTGQYFAVGGADALTSVWSIQDLLCIGTVSRLDNGVRSLSFSCDGALLASASEDKFIDIAYSQTLEKVANINVKCALNTVRWHPSRMALAFVGEDPHGTVNVVGLKTKS